MVDVIKLDNGLRVINEFMPDVESVSINIWVNTGSRNETKKQNGISHFLEHMAFKGTKIRNTQKIAEDFDDIGGRANAFTSLSKTAFYIKVLKEYTEKAVEILSDIFQNSVFDEKEMEKERNVILQEIAMIQDDPSDIIYTYYMNTAYKNQPFGRPIVGTKKNVETFTRDDIINYVKEQYKSDDIVISFAGNYKTDDAVSLVKKYFTKIQSGKNGKFDKAKWIGGNFIKNRKLEQTQIVFGYESCDYLCKKMYIADVLAVLLGGGMSSRLFQEIREKRGLCYSIGTYNVCSSDTGYFEVYCATSPDKVKECLDAIKNEMQKVTKNITNEEFNRAVVKLKTGVLMGMESNVNRSQKNASNLLSKDRIITAKEISDELDDVSIKKIQDYMEFLLSNSKPTLALLGKVGKDVKDYGF